MSNNHKHSQTHCFFSSFPRLPQPVSPLCKHKEKGSSLLFFILLVHSSLGLDTGVRAQPLPHHASPSLGMRDRGRGLRVWRFTGLRRRRRKRVLVVVVVVGSGGVEADTHLQPGERDRLKGLGRMRRGLQGSVTSGTHRVGVRVKWGGTSAIEGPGIVFFPWSATPPPPYEVFLIDPHPNPQI